MKTLNNRDVCLKLVNYKLIIENQANPGKNYLDANFMQTHVLTLSSTVIFMHMPYLLNTNRQILSLRKLNSRCIVRRRHLRGLVKEERSC